MPRTPSNGRSSRKPAAAKPRTKTASARNPSAREQPAGAPGSISVVVADAHPLVADSLAMALERFSDLAVAPVRFSEGRGAVAYAIEARPHVVIYDYWMDVEGPAAARLIHERHPGVAVLLTSWLHGAREVDEALKAGAAGFLPKSLSVGQVVDAIRRVNAGEIPVFAVEMDRLVDTLEVREDRSEDVWRRLAALTPREILILKLLSQGASIDAIRAEIFISEATARKHIQNILQKLGAHSQIEALAIARQFGVIQS